MRLGELLDQVPGLEKRFVYYLEAQGVIRPTRLPKTRIERRDYSDDDAARVRRVWRYYRRGYALSAARDRADEDAGSEAFVFAGVTPRRWDEALEALRASDRVLDAAIVYGEDGDLVVRLEAGREPDVFEALHAAFDHGLLTGRPIVRRARVALARPERRERSGTMTMRAFVLLRVPAKQVDRTLERMRALDGIVEAAAVYGETDIIARLEVASQDELDDLIFRRLQGLPEVEATRTFIVVGGLHWSRDEETARRVQEASAL
jgi:DNA-binding Lrp family transcriptional regulator